MLPTPVRVQRSLFVLLAFMLSACARPVRAQESASPDSLARWSKSFEAQLTFGDDAFVTPIASADHGALHLEARYQYEDFNTGSAWVGRRFTTGKTIALEIVPMAGVVLGGTTGAGPGLETTVSWKAFELYSENEYVLDLDQDAGNFLYTWTQLGWQAWPWLQVGILGQRSRTHAEGLDVQRGLFATASLGSFALSVYDVDFDRDDEYAIVGLGFDW